MKYYRLLDNKEKRWFLQAPEFSNGESFWDFVATGPIHRLQYSPAVRVRHKGRKVNITFADFDLLIVDSVAKGCFSDEDVQFHPVNICGEITDVGFALMTIVHGFDCVNEKLSEFEKYEADDEIRPDLAGSYKSIYKIVIDPKRVGEHDIFRLKGFDVAIIVSETLKNRLVAKGVTGIKFNEV